MNIGVIGTGYLGATHAACMAELGFDVVGLDLDQGKIERLSRGELPFYEPDLAELVLKHVQSGKLRFTTSYAEIGAWADVHFVGVGTPQRSDGGAADLSQVTGAFTALARNITRNATIIGKSTVPVGTSAQMKDVIETERRHNVQIDLAWNPEFLREGFAVQDTLSPDRLVLGTDSPEAELVARRVYSEAISTGTPFIATDLETAELVKVAANAFLATKISFINAFSEITEVVGGDIKTLAHAIGLDARIGRRFLNAGAGFGGGCLPKDIRAVQERTRELGLENTLRFLDEVDKVNMRRRDRIVDLANDILDGVDGAVIAVLGVAFKPNSDDVRDSPALDVASRLRAQGATIQVYDPMANANAARVQPQFEYLGSADDAVHGAHLVILMTEWQEFQSLAPAALAERVRDRNIIDGRGILDPIDWADTGWNLAALGRRHVPSHVPVGTAVS